MKKRFLAVLLLAVLLAMSMAQAAWAAEPANKVLAYTETNFVKYNYISTCEKRFCGCIHSWW